MRHTLGALVENHFGVLARVAGLFSRRGFNIESLAVGPTQDPTVSRITIVMEGDERTRDQMVTQLAKLVDVIKVEHLGNESMVARELALIKVRAGPSRRSQVMEIVDVFRAQVVDVSRETMTIEITGDDEKITALITLLEDCGVEEVARTGRIALARGSRTMRVDDGPEAAEEEEDVAWPASTTTPTPT